ncbi:MAG: polymer-forming cytoskeletal protein [Rhodocyclaceae bacterium]|jgi:cytoskeletal protein CcmA (bactofilin family)|nr:polymer-forming cytoskeletal protein [Rhodocyclaceae bacterium]MBK6554040.1 polymer-forming cytoskeletal protein [Rhodocyclaceae bacterium]MBK7813363.1 polymer-forming cytoskeletal protein [Rhodocyclaceae bacterium]MBK9310676.1 polymer-forming cytoskeletal protein [Rhodocyclaceae bacterium]MBK9954253.1 polymer-forming cytoskeletal protein [Rhodocyclaceae bacterium]
MFGKANTPKSRIDTLVGAGTTISGDVVFSGGLRVDGEIRGNIRAAGEQASTLVVSEHARIEGEIEVAHVVINGTVLGPVVSSSFLELQAKARVTGDVEYNSIEIHLGALVEGRLLHTGQAAKTVELKLASSN